MIFTEMAVICFVTEFLLFLSKVRLVEAQMTRQMTSKGQVTIPIALREELGLVPGDRVDFSEKCGGCFWKCNHSLLKNAVSGLVGWAVSEGWGRPSS